MKNERLKDFGIGLGFVVIQIVMFRHLRIYNMEPDLVLIYVLWIMTRRDRTTAILLAAGLGLVHDALLDMWGLHMFAKTLLAFIGFNIIPKSSETRLIMGQVFLIVLIASLVHNIIFLGLNVLVQSYSGELQFWRLWIGNAFYTAVLASFIRLFQTN